MPRMILVGPEGDRHQAVWMDPGQLGDLAELLEPLLKGGKAVTVKFKAKMMSADERGYLSDSFDGWEP